ncbi:MAG: hypothetical protein M2R45_01217 [Verrucomicrobia subdivision 3 bacterium]|nr:hypothetical protein [Limisphaerales bacterium]MCS1415231.1 hypothetical protein [Limisphaerales bacterium]
MNPSEGGLDGGVGGEIKEALFGIVASESFRRVERVEEFLE